jgi:hypothetical protein
MPAWRKRSWWILLLFSAVFSASALEVEEVKWGFDGQVVPGRFNLLSVLVGNPSIAPFDGAVNLYKSRGLEDRVGAMYAAPCYLSPQATRWVQFYVYIENQYDQWRLEWGRGADDRKDLEPPKWGAPADVLLSDLDTPLSVVSAFKQFPDELFPSTTAATSGLGTVLLDHVPRWEVVKRQAFLNWLRAGGKVHVLKGADGQSPVFSDELSVLNLPVDRTRIGAGLAVRHAVTAREIQTRDIEDPAALRQKPKPSDSGALSQITDSMLRSLAQLSHPRHNWAGIYLLAIVYLALVGPGNLLAGRRVADYRLRIMLLLGTIAGFACLFNLVGRRGQGEASVIHTLSYARQMGDDTYDVTQWINVFATRGAHYTFTHAAPHNLYATGQDYESVNGMIQSGKDGRFVVDIPMFSRRAFMHEAEMKGANMGVKIESWDGDAALKKLTLSARPDFTKQILEGWALQDGQVYPMKLTNGSLEFADSGKQPITQWLSGSGSQPPAYAYRGPYDTGADAPNVDAQFRELIKPLVTWSLGAEDLAQTNAPASVTDGRVQLFLFARSPDNFSVSGKQFGRETGYVLYHLDLFRPGS